MTTVLFLTGRLRFSSANSVGKLGKRYSRGFHVSFEMLENLGLSDQGGIKEIKAERRKEKEKKKKNLF